MDRTRFSMRTCFSRSSSGTSSSTLLRKGGSEPLWSEEIVVEFTRALQRDAGLTQAQCAHLVSQMRAFFPDAWGDGYTSAADGVSLPDEGDRHVVALALHHEADFIITRNLRHFPASVLRPREIDVVDPQEFISMLFAIDPSGVVRAAELHRTSLRAQPLTPEAYLDSLCRRAELPRVVALLRAAGFLQPSARVEQG